VQEVLIVGSRWMSTQTAEIRVVHLIACQSKHVETIPDEELGYLLAAQDISVVRWIG
jgi:hypothetical protein